MIFISIQLIFFILIKSDDFLKKSCNKLFYTIINLILTLYSYGTYYCPLTHINHGLVQ